MIFPLILFAALMQQPDDYAPRPVARTAVAAVRVAAVPVRIAARVARPAFRATRFAARVGTFPARRIFCGR